MTTWGLPAARGWVVYCGWCGTPIVFRQAFRPKPFVDNETARVSVAVARHFHGSARCRRAGTFEGRETLACRCSEAILLPREDGLFCARCEGLLAPYVAEPGTSKRRAHVEGAR
jgi:hypothetical protein